MIAQTDTEARATGVIVANLPDPESPRRYQPNTPAITIDPDILGGTPTIAGTRIPVVTLIDYLSEGHTVGEFIEEFETVGSGEIEDVLLAIREALAAGWLAERVG